MATDIFIGCPSIVAQSVSLWEQTRARECECLHFLIPPSQVPSFSLGPDDPMPSFKYLKLPPILFPELDTSRSQEIFRSDILIQVMYCIVQNSRPVGLINCPAGCAMHPFWGESTWMGSSPSAKQNTTCYYLTKLSGMPAKHNKDFARSYCCLHNTCKFILKQ